MGIRRLKQLNERARTKYRFADTITRHTQGKVYSVEVNEKLIPPGDYITEEVRTELGVASIVSLTNEDLKADLGGKYDHDNRKLYCYKLLEKGDKIVNVMNNGIEKKYTILEHEDKSDYDDSLHIYYLERSDL